MDVCSNQSLNLSLDNGEIIAWSNGNPSGYTHILFLNIMGVGAPYYE